MSKPEKPIDSSYPVGYGKPPEDTRFRKGQSGNPKGRPRGKLNLETVVKRALSAKVVVNENGRRQKKSKLEVSITQMANQAAAGDLKATRMMIGLLPARISETTGETLTPDLIADRAHATRIAARLAGPGPGEREEKDDEHDA